MCAIYSGVNSFVRTTSSLSFGTMTRRLLTRGALARGSGARPRGRRGHRAGGSGRAQSAGTRPRTVAAYRAGAVVDAGRPWLGERGLAAVRGCGGDAE